MCVFNMSALSASFYPPSNRRRCVKGRQSYTEPSDSFVSSAAVNNDHSSDSFNQADYNSLDPLEPDDVDEEPITIDLSAFLNENPLLAQSAFECSSENNVASTESSSQFRVTDCEIKTPEINRTELPKTDFSDASSTVNINGSASETALNESSVPSVFSPNAILASDTRDSIKENCLNLPKSFPSINVINNEPAQDITLNGKKSPIKKFSKAKPLGLSNPLKKYKNLKTKDINKTNVKVFGKYPVVKCEKLDIENLIKNNKIKISNWPLHHTNKSPKNNRNLLNKNGLANKKLTLSKSSSKPKLLRKPMNFSKYLINANKESAADKVSNILVDSYDATTKSVVIQNDCWRPEITSTPIPTIFTSPIKTAQFVQKTVLGSMIKHDSVGDSVSQLVSYNPIQSGRNLHIGKKPPFITNVNKVKILPKTYPFIAPKPVPHSQEMTSGSPGLSKAVFQTLLEPVPSDFTVIEPYIDDPSSPVKPKPILTVPVEVIPSPEKQNIELHSSISHKNENSGDAIKSLKTGKSVFLNGAIKQFSTPTRLKKEISVMKKDNIVKWKLDSENVFNTHAVSIIASEEKDDIPEECVSDLKVNSPEESFSGLQAKNAVVDAMQNVFSAYKIKRPKPRLARKEPHNSIISDTSTVGCSYNSALNDLLFGCTETDFDDSFNTDEDSNAQSSVTSTPHDALTSPFKTPSRESNKMNESVESIYTPTGSKRERKRKKISLDSPSTSDTLSASECENECDNARKENSPRRKLRNNTSLSDNVSENIEFSSVCDIFNKSGKSDTPGNDLTDSIPPESINYPESNKNFNIKHTDSSLSLHNLEKSVTVKFDEEIQKGKIFSYEKDKQSDNPNSVHNELSTSNIEDSLLNKKINSESNLMKSETCTRTLRERKCSSTEVDKLSDNSVKQSPHRNAQDKNSKSIKGSINSKLKIQMKTPPRSTAKVKIKRKSCKPDDIIREINTITGGQLSLKKGLKKYKKGSDSDKDIKNSELSSNKEDSESNSSSVSFQWNRHSRAFSKKKKTLKVHFKRSKKRNAASCLPMRLNSLTAVLENANSASSLPENNVSLHSSFREGKAENMGTPCKEENSSHNDTSISEHSVESVETDEKNTDGERLLSNAHEDSMVNSSETSLIQDSTSVINSDLNSTVSDSSLCIENQKINCETHESSEESEYVDSCNKLDSNKENSILSENNEFLNMSESDLECSNFISEAVSGESSNNVISKNSLEKIPCSTLSNNNLEESTAAVLSEVDEKSSDASHPQGNLHETDSLTLEDNMVTPPLTSDNNCEIDMLTETSNFDMTSDVLNQEDSFENNTSVIEEIENAVLEAVEITSDEIEENFAHRVQESSALEERENVAVLAEKTLDVSENIADLDEKTLDVSENIVHQADEITTNKVDEYSAPKAGRNSTDENAPETHINEDAVFEVDKTSEKDTNENIVPEVNENMFDVPTEFEKSFHDDSENVTFEPCKNDALEADKNEIHLKLHGSTCVPEPKINDTLETVIDNNKTSKSLETIENADVSKCADDKSRKTDAEISGNAVTDHSVNNLDDNLSIKGDMTVKQSDVDSSDNMLNPVTQERNNEVFKSNDVTPKKCPKIKISFIKNPSEGSPDSLKNWYVSESKLASEEKTAQTEVPETRISKSNECNNGNIRDASDSEHKIDFNFSASVKGDCSDFSVTAAAVDNSDEVGTDNFDTSLDKSESSPKELPTEKVDDEHVVVKEEPMDFEEENEGLASDNLNIISGKHEVKHEPAVEISKKRGRGRPRSSNIGNKSSTSKLNISFASASQEPSSIVTPKPRGRKKKISSPVTPISNTNTPGRKKNYVPELVIVPFSMGWMREHVIRATETKDHRRPSDIYYFAPDGTKLRSMPEISVYLSKHKEIKLSMENFTFAKELIYREPFEIERDARHPAKKPSIPTPVKKNVSSKTPSSAGKKAKVKHESTKQISVPAALSIKEEPDVTLPDNTSPSVEAKVKKASKRKNSLSKEIAATVHEESESSNCDSENSSRVSRPSRKIVKKVPFDNSSENKLPRKQKLVVQQNSGVSNIKIVNVKSVTKENEQLDDKPTTVSDSQSVSEKNEPSVNKLTPPTTVCGNIPDVFLPKRTSEKTSLIQKRLKVKLAPKKSDNVLHKPCTKFCNFAYARKPSVKCCICLCLFHPECIPFKPTGQTKYACVPCVRTQIENAADPLPETSYRADFDTQLFSPIISLHIKSDPNFNAVFNKFYSPVDQSFVKSCEEFNSDNFCQSANHNNANIAHHFAPSVNRCTRYIVEKNSLDSFLHHSDKVLSNAWFPTSGGGISGGQTGHQSGVGIPNFRTGANYSRPHFENPLPTYFNFYNYPPNVTAVNNINALGSFRNVLLQSSNYVSVKPVSSAINKNLPVLGNIVNSSKTCSNSVASNQISDDKSLQNMCNLIQSNSPVLQTLLQTSDNASSKDSESNHSSIIMKKQSSLCDEKAYSKKSKLDDSLTLKDCSSVIPVSAAVSLGTMNRNMATVTQNTSYPKYIVYPLDESILVGNQNNVADNSSQKLLNISDKIALNNSLAALKTLTHSITVPESSDNFIISASNAVLQNSGVAHNMLSKEVSTQASESNDPSNFSTVVNNVLPKAFENNNESNKRKSDSFDNVHSDNHPQDSKKLKVDHSTQPSPVKGSIKENECTDHQSSFWDINKFSQVYECLNLIFKFLNVSDLLRACLVCRSWKHLATQKFLWENVHFSGLAVTDWNKCCRTLQKYGTKFIDFRGIVDQDSTKAWGAFSKNVKRLAEVEEFIFEKVPPFIIHSITECSSQLKRLTCYCLTSVFTEPEIWATPCDFELASLRYLGCLQLLKISSMGGIILDDQAQSLMPYLPNLTHLVLTGFKFHSYMNLECLSQQQQLISLELGDCDDLEPQIYGLLAKLTNLRNLCLQNGGILNDRKLPEAVLKMKWLENLELMNFQVSEHLGNVLKQMDNLTHFSIWPDITYQAALINFNSFHAVTSCTNLKNICWGILTEDDTVPNILEMKDPNKEETDKLTFEELFQTLVKHFPGKNVEVKCLPRSIWSEYCSSREFM